MRQFLIVLTICTSENILTVLYLSPKKYVQREFSEIIEIREETLLTCNSTTNAVISIRMPRCKCEQEEERTMMAE